MIKKYKQYITESLLNKIEGPTIDDVIKNLTNRRRKLTKKLALDLLYKAVSIKNTELIKYILDRFDLDPISTHAIFLLIKDNEYEYVKKCFEMGYRINFLINDRFTNYPILKVALNASNEMFYLVYKYHKESITLTVLNNLLVADLYFRLDYNVFKPLFELGADVHFKNDTLLKILVKLNHIDIIKGLLNEFKFKNSTIKYCMNFAIKEKYNEVVDLLKNYNLFNESLLDVLRGPTEEEVEKYLNSIHTRDYKYIKHLYRMDVNGEIVSGIATIINNMLLGNFMYFLIHSIYEKDDIITKFILKYGYDKVDVNRTENYSLVDTLMYQEEDSLLNYNMLNIFINYDKKYNKGILNIIKQNQDYINRTLYTYKYNDNMEMIIYLLDNGLKPTEKLLDSIIEYSYYCRNNRFSMNYNTNKYYDYLIKYKDDNYA